MKEIVLTEYQCEKCFAKYEDKQTAIECEEACSNVLIRIEKELPVGKFVVRNGYLCCVTTTPDQARKRLNPGDRNHCVRLDCIKRENDRCWYLPATLTEEDWRDLHHKDLKPISDEDVLIYLRTGKLP